MNLKDDVCAHCHTVDSQQLPDEPFLFSKENNLDPDNLDPDLPDLSQVEEMLISHMHVSIEVCQVREHQYKYKDHIISFLRDTGCVYDALPLLPKNLDVIILKPSNSESNPRLQYQFH
ncbi:hypothetical protein EMPG_15105 [Blastomyces silverae]|uniref:DUF6570 domain-containing protein n=1 Tax=Blastomyces silverae TaxID=2060906 RepID=A0A0H1BJX5_9EURO|nr:hypothetical protein EMPG_15105 [Blastomyces silverae]